MCPLVYNGPRFCAPGKTCLSQVNHQLRNEFSAIVNRKIYCFTFWIAKVGRKKATQLFLQQWVRPTVLDVGPSSRSCSTCTEGRAGEHVRHVSLAKRHRLWRTVTWPWRIYCTHPRTHYTPLSDAMLSNAIHINLTLGDATVRTWFLKATLWIVSFLIRITFIGTCMWNHCFTITL